MDERGAVLSRDTSRAIEARQVERWRALSSAERAALIAGASQMVRDLAFAGLRARHPKAGERELLLRYAILTLGPSTAAQIYPDAHQYVNR
jgi:hypothetical protein